MDSVRYYSNGKLLLTGEYLVLDGAEALAVPSKFGQDLTVQSINDPELIWASFTQSGNCWFEASFSLPKLRLTSATFNSNIEGSSEFIAETLQKILQQARKLNPNFLNTSSGFIAKTKLTFSRNWGLGSSSTLINNIAEWAQIDPFTLLENSFSGSGYDIACAKNNTPILYQIEEKKPIIKKVNFNPNFKDQLFFVHLNQKKNSREGIAQYKKVKDKVKQHISSINDITHRLLICKSINDFGSIIKEHEQIISGIIKEKPVKKKLFSNYFGEIKSLGAWGGDFILATGNNDTPEYFKNKGFKTILSYNQMIL